MQFSPFLVFRPWRKRCFCCFYSSAVAESRFSAFFVRRTPTKRSFSHFLLVVPLRKTVFRRFSHFVDRRRACFCIFWLSEGLKTHFSAFFAFLRSRKAIFPRFPLIRGLGRSFFSVFASVAYRNLNRFLTPASCFTNDLYTL